MIQRTRILTKRYWDGSFVFKNEDKRTVPYVTSSLNIYLRATLSTVVLLIAVNLENCRIEIPASIAKAIA